MSFFARDRARELWDEMPTELLLVHRESLSKVLAQYDAHDAGRVLWKRRVFGFGMLAMGIWQAYSGLTTEMPLTAFISGCGAALWVYSFFVTVITGERDYRAFREIFAELGTDVAELSALIKTRKDADNES